MYPMPSLTHMLDILGNSSRGVTHKTYWTYHHRYKVIV